MNNKSYCTQFSDQECNQNNCCLTREPIEINRSICEEENSNNNNVCTGIFGIAREGKISS